ncbi:MAG: SAM-dependent methyltransferase, partial [Clostridia bacterium]|nr:SAM-dependent methyltransferase [Clostridia bacterium]
MNAEKNMTPRLLAIADCVTKGSTIADIGTDHAYIPIYLMQKGIIKKAYAMDINEGPISRAEDNILKFKMDDKIVTRLSDGLKKLELGEADEIVIAGMGGILISEILDARQD